MSATRWERVAALFEQAVELPPGERTAFVSRSCGADPALSARVHELLAADAAAIPVLDDLPDTITVELAGPEPGLPEWRVGPYRLGRILGQGGMGIVYLAQRDDLKNFVALKILLRGPAFPMHEGWFRREQAVHARLEHPYIARLLDAGVADDGTPWLVMEYVDGSAIDRHCDDARLPLPERLALFEKVAEAVAYAHRNLVVHRDLKPSNILVHPSGMPKLVDFGIAKPIEVHPAPGRSPAHTMRAFTMAYAAPEQLRNEPITTATDVYQLGLLLHELLVGVPACGARDRVLDPFARLGGHEPIRPSQLVEVTTIQTDRAPPPAPAVRSALRGTTPERLGRMLRGDLDTIVLKAIHPEPDRRYSTAQQLLEDVRRYREGQPVLARAGSPRYRLGKLVRRHRLASALIAVLLLVLLGGTAAIHIQSHRVARERDRAAQFSRLLEGLIYDTDPLGVGDSVSARTVLDRTARQARAGLAAEPELWGRLLVVVGRTYQNLGLFSEAVAAQRDALAALEPAAPGSPLIIDALRSLGGSLVQAGDLTEAVARLEQAVAAAGNGGDDTRAGMGAALGDLARAHFHIGRLDSAATLYRRGLAVLQVLPDSGGAEFDRLRVDLGNVLLQGSQLAEAEQLLGGAVSRLTAREGAENGTTLHARIELADILLKRGRLTPAAQMATGVLEVRRRLSPGPHKELAEALLQHGRAMAESERMPEAEQSLRESLAMWRELTGERSISVAYAQVQLADALKRAGKAEEALALEQNALEQYLELSGPASPGAVYTTARLARSEHLLGRVAASEQRFREVMPRLDSTRAGQGRLVRPFTDFAELLVDQNKCREAEPYLRRAIAIAEPGWGPAHPWSIRPRRLLGDCLTTSRRFAEAESLLTSTWRDAGRSGEYAPRMRADVAAALSRLYDEWGKPEVARRYR